jgi:hypothetical protein
MRCISDNDESLFGSELRIVALILCNKVLDSDREKFEKERAEFQKATVNHTGVLDRAIKESNLI